MIQPSETGGELCIGWHYNLVIHPYELGEISNGQTVNHFPDPFLRWFHDGTSCFMRSCRRFHAGGVARGASWGPQEMTLRLDCCGGASC